MPVGKGLETRIRHLEEKMNAALDRFLKRPIPPNAERFRDLCQEIIERMENALDEEFPEELPVRSSPRPGMPGLT